MSKKNIILFLFLILGVLYYFNNTNETEVVSFQEDVLDKKNTKIKSEDKVKNEMTRSVASTEKSNVSNLINFSEGDVVMENKKDENSTIWSLDEALKKYDAIKAEVIEFEAEKYFISKSIRTVPKDKFEDHFGEYLETRSDYVFFKAHEEYLSEFAPVVISQSTWQPAIPTGNIIVKVNPGKMTDFMDYASQMGVQIKHVDKDMNTLFVRANSMKELFAINSKFKSDEMVVRSRAEIITGLFKTI